MNARDIIKLAAQLYVYDALKKKITIQRIYRRLSFHMCRKGKR